MSSVSGKDGSAVNLSLVSNNLDLGETSQVLLSGGLKTYSKLTC